MKGAAAKLTDERLIREPVKKLTTATRFGKRDEILAKHASDVSNFDALHSLKSEGADVYRRSWEELSSLFSCIPLEGV